MPRLRKPPTAPRKQPSQGRSKQTVADILQAAIRVLEREGPLRFTTIRVAEAAGISVGSLYQYFPNKQAIALALQVEEWQQTGAMLDAILSDETRSTTERIRAALRAFFKSECDEAPLRHALDAAATVYHEAPEVREHRAHSRQLVAKFITRAAPRASAKQRAFAADLLSMTISAIGKQLSERDPTLAEVEHWADEVADMLGGYFKRLAA